MHQTPYTRIFLSLIILFFCTTPVLAQVPVAMNTESLYWYGIALLLGLCSMIGLMAALASLYTKQEWLNKTALIASVVNVFLGIIGLMIYVKYPTVGWVTFLPLGTAIVSGLMVMTKRK